MKTKQNSSQHIGLFILILILLLGWVINNLFSVQGDLGSIERENNIFILVTGVVKNPGVYVFDREPSLKELMAQAGYLKAKLIDAKLCDTYPSVAQGTSVQISSENGHIHISTGPMPAAYKITLKIPVSVNTASLEELDTIPGIGPTLAEKIINYISLYGPFNTIEEIKNVPGMGKLRYLQIKPYISI
ncbi:MAG TPA: helix-hairpin-helix domain-containing protein [Desulfatiglandales bacterium]|nr:helix-hairpin-helix domain-containing protein [Desulfatiglandales bacterium]